MHGPADHLVLQLASTPAGRSAPGCRSAPVASSWCAARHGVGLLDASQALDVREESADHLALQLASTPAGRS
ncbi:hypothetical protein QYE73_26110, partial [Pseudomonas mosselii]|uniref:hypothetical protein n=1 Tax=Pseudomonas mosselii TaxID=78327 RepID=UPI0026172D88